MVVYVAKYITSQSVGAVRVLANLELGVALLIARGLADARPSRTAWAKVLDNDAASVDRLIGLFDSMLTRVHNQPRFDPRCTAVRFRSSVVAPSQEPEKVLLNE